MDDFLHNLRSGKLKQTDRNRRDQPDYRGPQRRGGNERRRPDYYTKVTNENFALVKDSLELLANRQRGIEEKLSKLNETGIRIAVALEKMAGSEKSHLFPSTITQVTESANGGPSGKNGRDTVQTVLSDTQTKTIGKTKLEKADKPLLLDIISTMRGEGKSWEKIARHMDDINIPTVSGKGKWRGVSIKKFWDTYS